MKNNENERKKERITVEDFLLAIPDAKPIFEWFKDMVLVEKEHDKNQNRDFYWLTIETRYDRQYNVRINRWEDGTVGFCAWTTNRLIRPFESWNRGNDFTEGTMNKATVVRFIKDVIDDLFVKAPSLVENPPRLLQIEEENIC